MIRPRLIYHNDAHHYHAKRLDPPLNLHKMHWPVDEVLGTGVDLLSFGLGYADVYFHNSKVGRSVGQAKEVWEQFIDWRVMRTVEDARNMGTDQLREVIKRGREMGLSVFPSLKLQDYHEPPSEWRWVDGERKWRERWQEGHAGRCGWLKWEHGADVCLRETDDRLPHTEWMYDFSLEIVREDKLAMIREVLEDYEADGIELYFMYRPRYFRKAEVEQNIPVMNRFVAQVRELANAIGREQGRGIPIMANVYSDREENLAIGLDVETWLKERSIDLVVGGVPASLFETGLDVRWLADAANDVGVAAYIRPPRRVYDERTSRPSVEMFRALSQTLHWQGIAGMYLIALPWPFSQTEYQILREVAYPDPHARRDKRYILQPGEPAAGGQLMPPERQLPVELEEGKAANIGIVVGDDLDSARADGEMRKPVLTIRFSFFCVEDEVEIRFNGRVLPIEEAEITDERALSMPVQPLNPIDAPLGFSAHWFRYKLDIDLLRRGENTLEIETKKLTKTAGFVRSVNGVEIQTRYKEFERPQGLEADRVAPQ